MTFEELYPVMKSVAEVFKFKNSRCGYFYDTDEIVNEIWIRLQRKKINSFYIRRQCKQCAIDYLRTKSGIGCIPASNIEYFDIEDNRYTPDVDFPEAFIKLCEGLSDKLKDIAFLMYIEGLSMADVSRKYNIGRNVVHYINKKIINHFKFKLLQAFGVAA